MNDTTTTTTTTTTGPDVDVELIHEAFPALFDRAPYIADVLRQYQVVTLRSQDAEVASVLPNTVALLCRRPHGAGAATVLVHLTVTDDGSTVEILPGSSIRANQAELPLAQLVELALDHEDEDHS